MRWAYYGFQAFKLRPRKLRGWMRDVMRSKKAQVVIVAQMDDVYMVTVGWLA